MQRRRRGSRKSTRMLQADELERETKTLEELLGPGVCERAALQSSMLLEAAGDDERVIGLRHELFDHFPLTAEEAGNLVMSDAARVFSPLALRASGIHIVGHHSRWCMPDGSSTTSLGPHMVLRVEWGDGQCIDFPFQEDWYDRPGDLQRELAYPTRHLVEARRWVLRWSVLDEIREVAVRIASRWLWGEHEALWFLLTNTLLHPLPVRGSIHARSTGSLTLGRVKLEIEPWVPAARVAAVYKAVQSGDFKPGRKSSQGRKLALLEFMARNELADTEAAGTELHYRLWNQECQHGARKHERCKRSPCKPEKWKYDSLKSFNGDVKRAREWSRREMVSPNYRVLRSPIKRAAPRTEQPARDGSATSRRSRRSLKA